MPFLWIQLKVFEYRVKIHILAIILIGFVLWKYPTFREKHEIPQTIRLAVGQNWEEMDYDMIHSSFWSSRCILNFWSIPVFLPTCQTFFQTTITFVKTLVKYHDLYVYTAPRKVSKIFFFQSIKWSPFIDEKLLVSHQSWWQEDKALQSSLLTIFPAVPFTCRRKRMGEEAKGKIFCYGQDEMESKITSSSQLIVTYKLTLNHEDLPECFSQQLRTIEMVFANACHSVTQ